MKQNNQQNQCSCELNYSRRFQSIKIDMGNQSISTMAKISVTSSIVINMPARELLVGETKNSFV